jgi:hypothetical protein
MTVVARGLAAGVLLAVCLGACTPHKPVVSRVSKPPSPAPAATAPEEQEPVPSAAPRTPVETEGVAPPPAHPRRS